jgi:hypothetical protein
MTDHELSRTSDGLMLKHYGPNAHDRARREWLSLTVLHKYEPMLAPKPVFVDLEATRPSITMSVLPGDPLGGQALSSPELRAMREALDRLYTCVPREELVALPTCFDAPQRAVGVIAGQLGTQPRPGGDAVVTSAYDEALRWLAGSEADRLQSDEPDTVVLGRGDNNLANFLWDGDRIRLVDFEYAGWSDRCAEIADLIEHISARSTPDETWQQFLDEFDLSPADSRRVLSARRLYSMEWLFLLLPGQAGERRNPPGTLQMQAQRTLDLLNT